MKNVTLSPGYSISPLIKGCWQLSSGHRVGDTRRATSDLMAFAKAGITTFDCADIYTGVEETLGRFRIEYSSEYGKTALDELRFHTKFVPDLDALASIDRAYVERIIDRSRRRLRMDQLDLVQFHWWDFSVPGHVEAALHLVELQKAGKIRHIGVTNYDVAHLDELVDAGVNVFSNQVQYSVLDTRPEHGMKAFCFKHGIRLFCYGTVAGGFLSNRWLGAEEPIGEAENRSLTKYKLVIDDIGSWRAFQELLASLESIARKYDIGIAELVSAYTLSQETVAAVILGASAKRLDDMRLITSLVLDPSDIRSIRSATKAVNELSGDVYELERKPGKHSAIMRYNLNALAGTGDDG